MAHQGQAADYYNGGGAPQQPQDAYYQGQPKYGQQQPPQYGQEMNQNYAPPQGAPPMQQQNGYQQDGYGADSKTFEQQFKLEKPKYNDWWAGLLFIAVFLGYVAVSAISIRGYSNQHSGGIYGNTNQFALNSNTIILFAFVLGMAVLLSYAYMWAARAFTKQFIWITGILSKYASSGVRDDVAREFRSSGRPRKRFGALQAYLHYSVPSEGLLANRFALDIIFGFVTAIYMLSRHYWSGGIVFLLFSVFYVFCFISWSESSQTLWARGVTNKGSSSPHSV
jgi:hypothetical protein